MTYTFGYNAANQIVTRQVSNDAYTAHPGALSYVYATNGLNQYGAVTGVPALPAGNLGAALTYDPLDRLQSSTANGTTTNFLYDGDALVGEYTPSGGIVARYATAGPGADEPLVWYQGGGTATRSWLGADNLGSIVLRSDSSGNSQATYAYGPYGEPVTSSGAPAWGDSRYRYTGQIEIPEAQLYYYKARAYDPATGRFLQTDPIGLESDVNLYAYAVGDPVNGADPTGTDCSSSDADPGAICINPDQSGGVESSYQPGSPLPPGICGALTNPIGTTFIPCGQAPSGFGSASGGGGFPGIGPITPLKNLGSLYQPPAKRRPSKTRMCNNVQIGLALSGITAMGSAHGSSIGAGISFPQFQIYATLSSVSLNGFGTFAGVGAQASIGATSKPLETYSPSTGDYTEYDGGFGDALGSSAAGDSAGLSGASDSLKDGFGAGLYRGQGTIRSRTFAYPPRSC